jgi:hypothetical protein
MKHRMIASLSEDWRVMMMIKTLARDLALLSLIESRLTVGELLVKLKRLGDTKYLTAILAKIEDALK